MFGIVVLFRRESLKSKPSSQKKNTEEKKSEEAKTERSHLWESLTKCVLFAKSAASDLFLCQEMVKSHTKCGKRTYRTGMKTASLSK